MTLDLIKLLFSERDTIYLHSLRLLRETKNEIRVKNVIIQLAEEFPIPNDDKNRLDYKVIGSGKSYVLLDGKVIEGTWKKDSLNSKTRFFDLSGKEVELNRGKIWVSVVPSRNEGQIYFNDSNKTVTVTN